MNKQTSKLNLLGCSGLHHRPDVLSTASEELFRGLAMKLFQHRDHPHQEWRTIELILWSTGHHRT